MQQLGPTLSKENQWAFLKTEHQAEYLGLKDRKYEDGGEKCIMKSITISTTQEILGWTPKWRWAGM
jgi:hypothetical protein